MSVLIEQVDEVNGKETVGFAGIDIEALVAFLSHTAVFLLIVARLSLTVFLALFLCRDNVELWSVAVVVEQTVKLQRKHAL